LRVDGQHLRLEVAIVEGQRGVSQTIEPPVRIIEAPAAQAAHVSSCACGHGLTHQAYSNVSFDRKYQTESSPSVKAMISKNPQNPRLTPQSGTTILVLLQLREVPHVSGWIQNLHSAVIVRLENFGCSFFDPLRAMVARRVPQ